MDESPRWFALNGKNDKADEIVTGLEAKAAAAGKSVPEVTEEEIQRREQEQEVKQLPFSFLFKKKMLPRTLNGNACFTMNVIVYTVTWTLTILGANGFDTSLATLTTVVMQMGIPIGVGLRPSMLRR